MANTIKTDAKLKTFEVGYKGYYYEYDEWFTDHIEAKNEEEGLKIFSKEHFTEPECKSCGYPRNVCQSFEGQKDHPHEFDPPPIGPPNDWRWEEGDWLMAFRYIKEVKMRRCPQCKGTGRIALDVRCKRNF